MRGTISRLVLGLAAIVAGTLLLTFFGVGYVGDPPSPEARRSVAAAGVEQLVNAVNLYKMDHGRLPDSLEDLLHPPREGRAVAAYVNTRDNLFDPWQHPFEYRVHDDGRVEITSWGRDGVPGGEGEDADVSSDDP